jgi:hypothetical protein
MNWLKLSFAFMCVLLAPAAASAQGSIAGVVRDASGGVLPGVTVEASSPALIEKVRSVVTDGTGQYQVVDLRPGTYTVAFRLQGFRPLVREGIQLTGSFAATVDAELIVGALQETLTVTAESPTVDVQSTKRTNVIPAEVIDALPAARSQYQLTALVPGVVGGNQDVGGTTTMRITTFAIHGGRNFDQRLMINGLTSRNLLASAWASNFVPDMSAATEVAIDYATGTADSIGGGLAINVIPKEGGNTFAGQFFATGANKDFQSSNYSQRLADLGLGSPNTIKRVYDINGSYGGPIIRDRLWFFGTIRWQESSTFVAGAFENRNAGDLTKWTYDPDLSKPGFGILEMKPTGGVRLTWQATPRNKIGFSADPQSRHWLNGLPANRAPEIYPDWIFHHESFITGSYSSPVTNRLLIDARFANHAEGFVDKYPEAGDPFRRAIPVEEQTTGFRYRGKGYCCIPFAFFGTQNAPFIMQAQASVSYVTGSHAFKFGFQNDFGTSTQEQFDNELGLFYFFRNGVPVGLEQHALPLSLTTHLSADLGLYAQDRWTIDRATINLGLRFEYFKNDFPEHRLGPASFLPNRNLVIPKTDFYNMKDLSPRVGFAYDLFGDGRTSVKTSWGKYMIGLSPTTGNPASLISYIARRSWTPSLPLGHPSYYTPQCNLNSPAANGDCGPLDNALFGQLLPSAALDPETYTGWGNRPWNQEFSASIQREIAPRVSADFGYFRRWYGNFTVVDNRALSAGNFVEYSITAPTDSRLELSGQRIGGLLEVRPDKIGQVDNYTTFADNFGKQIEHWNGFDLTVNARLREGVVVQGGMSTGRTSTDNCDLRRALPEVAIGGVSATPERYCHIDTKFLTQYKAFGTYRVPKVDVQIGVTYQALPGPEVAGNFVVGSAQTEPQVQLAPGFRLVNIVPPGTQYAPYINQLDLRFSKIFRMRGTRAMLNFDLANALNSADFRGINTSFGSRWQAPITIMDPRLFKISAQFDF